MRAVLGPPPPRDQDGGPLIVAVKAPPPLSPSPQGPEIVQGSLRGGTHRPKGPELTTVESEGTGRHKPGGIFVPQPRT